MALVLAETVAGTAALLWLTPLWNEVKRGFFTLTGVILRRGVRGLARGRAGAIAGDDAGIVGVRLALASTASRACAALFSSGTRPPASWASSRCPLSIAVLVAMSATGGQTGARAVPAAGGAAFLGSVLDGLLLGHWYLTDRGLSRDADRPGDAIMLAAVVVEAAAVIAGGFGGVGRPTRSTRSSRPVRWRRGSRSGWWRDRADRGAGEGHARGERASAVQSATGFFYLAVVTAFTAEVAVKTRFLPG